MLVHLVADFGAFDLAFAEVTQAIVTQLPEAKVVATTVGPFDTLAAGFVAAQLAGAAAPANTLMLLNVAPRRDDARARVDNDGERLLLAVMPSGMRVLGVDAGNAFSFLAEAAAELWAVDWPTKGSQFRSRDLFPEAVARLHAGSLPLMGAALTAAAVPAVPEGRVAYVDGFGNVKTTLRWGADLEQRAGAEVDVEVGGVTRRARVVTGSFGVAEGELAVAPGSSGYRTSDGRTVRWVELFLRGGSAARALSVAGSGSAVSLRP